MDALLIVQPIYRNSSILKKHLDISLTPKCDIAECDVLSKMKKQKYYPQYIYKDALHKKNLEERPEE